ncbi:MAG: lysylphosphatidylglycerol synthase transmembrane domain-containing protein [Hylemonella sp.]
MKLPFKPLLVVLGLVASAYALALLWSNTLQPVDLFQQLLSPSGLMAMLLCLVNYILRGLRWRDWMSLYQRPMAWGQALRIYLAGYTFTPTPGNLGEAVRGLMIDKQPLTPLQSLGIFGAERVADLLALLILSVPGLFWLMGVYLPLLPPYWLGLGMALAALLMVAIWRLLPKRLLRIHWLKESWLCLQIRPGRWLALTIPAWAAQGLALWLLCQQQAIPIDPMMAVGLYAMAMVGGALSMLPAGLGGTEALLTGFLMASGVGLGVAMTITVVVRLLTLWLAVALGAFFLLYSAAIRKEIRLL